MQHRVLDPADVQVDAAGPVLRVRPHPVPLDLGVDQPLGVGRVQVADLVPAGPGPLRHRVGLAAVSPRPVAQVQLDLDPVGQPGQRRLGVRVGRVRTVVRARREVGHVRQLDRQHRLRQRQRQPVGVVDDRERLPPVPLPAEQPVPQLVGDRRLAPALGRQPGGDPGLRLLRAQPVQRDLGVRGGHQDAVPGVPLRPLDRRGVPADPVPLEPLVRRRDDLDDRQPEPLRELQIPLVVRRHRHDRPGAVAHQHVVGDEDRHLPAVDRVQRGGRR